MSRQIVVKPILSNLQIQTNLCATDCRVFVVVVGVLHHIVSNVAFARSSSGTTSPASLAFCSAAVDHIVGKSGLGLLAASEILEPAPPTPSAVELVSAPDLAAGAPGSQPLALSAGVPGSQPLALSAGEPGTRPALSAGAPSPIVGLPAAPSEFRASAAKGVERAKLISNFAALCDVGKKEGRFGQPVVFRFKGGATPVKAVGIQPVNDSIWQVMRLFEFGELTDIEPPSKVVDMLAGVAAKARKGDLVLVDKGTAKHEHAKYQRGVDLFSRLYDDLQHASEMYTRDDGKPHPIMFIDLTSWTGDSISAMLRRSVAAQRAGAKKSLVYALFSDCKDVHVQVSKARRDIDVRSDYTEGRLKIDGFDPLPLPEDIKSLQGEVQKPWQTSLSVLSTTERDGQYYLTMPDVANLSFQSTPAVEKRLAELRKDFPAPPAAKRPRVGACATVGAAAGFPNSAAVSELLKQFTMVKADTIQLAGQDFRVLRMERKTDSAIVHYLQNLHGTRKTVPAKTHVTSTTAGRFYNRAKERALLKDDLLHWDFSITSAPYDDAARSISCTLQ